MSLIKVIEAWKQSPLKDILLKLYIDRDLSIQQVADELKVSAGVVYKWLKKYNITKNNNLWK